MFAEKSAQRRGFTIVELLIVVVVIAILAAITIVSFNGITARATLAGISSDLASNAKSLETKKIEFGQGTYKPAISQFLNIEGGHSTVKFKYGTPTSFCLEATSKSDSTKIYYIDSTIGLTKIQEGTCPTPTTTGQTQCVAGEAYVTMRQRNTTAGNITTTLAGPYGGNTGTHSPTTNYSVASGSNLSSIPRGFFTATSVGVSGNDFSVEIYQAYEPRTC